MSAAHVQRVATKALKLGMYVHAVPGSWLDHPFWARSFELRKPSDIERLRESGIEAVWVDLQRSEVPPEPEAMDDTVERATVAPPSPEPQGEAAPHEVESPVELESELHRAWLLREKAREAMVGMFEDARMGRAVEPERVRPLVDEVANSVARNEGALISLLRLKTADDYTYLHSVAVCALMVAVARRLGLGEDRVRAAGMGGLLHDLGKAAMPRDVLLKPGRLTEAELQIMRTHPAAGHASLQRAGVFDPVALDVCLHHHERVDGMGYPHGLQGADISLMARAAAVCDVYDAITSDRPYKKGWEPGESIRHMANWKGHFDEPILHAFVRAVGIYPVGSLVRLASGQLAIVLDQGGKSLLQPRVRIIFCTRRGLPVRPRVLDLAAPACDDRIVSTASPAEAGALGLQGLFADVGVRVG